MKQINDFSKRGASGQSRRAFSLIELLIVVAIIAILAAIAVPNFLEAQVRAKVARALADMRTMATGIETYNVDYNMYPHTRDWEEYYLDVKEDDQLYISTRLRPLTTPVSYLASMPEEIFPPQAGWNGKTNDGYSSTLILASFDTYDYFDAKSDYDDFLYTSKTYGEANVADYDADSTRGCAWRLASPGPDLWGSYGIVWTEDGLNSQSSGAYTAQQGFDYDATNGTVSNGDIVFLGPRIRRWNPTSATQQSGSWYEF